MSEENKNTGTDKINEELNEIKIEEVGEETDVLLLNITKIVVDMLDDDVKLASLNIDNDLVETAKKIIQKYPKGVSRMQKHIHNILHDSVIDIKDVPHMVLIVKDFINHDSQEFKNLKISKQEVIDFIRVVLVILIESNVIKISPENKVTILATLDTCIILLESSLNLSETLTLNSFLCCFKKN